MSEFSTGQRVYLDDGDLVAYVCLTDAGHVVSPLLFDGSGDDEPKECSPIVVNRVWAKPPVTKRYDELQKIEDRVAELIRQERQLRESVAAAKKDSAERQKELSKWSGLQTLEDFIAGRITHVVINDYEGPRITTFKETATYFEDRRENGLKLVSLFGRSDGNHEWRINQYYDGSGTWQTILPATSHDEAVGICRKLFDEAMAELADRTKPAYRAGKWLKVAEVHGFEVPVDVAERFYEDRLKSEFESLEKARLDMAERESRIVALSKKMTPKVTA